MSDRGLSLPAGGMSGIAITVLAGVLASALFLSMPAIDLAVSGFFAEGRNGFTLARTWPVTGPRQFFNLLFASFCALAVLGLVAALLFEHRPFGQGWREWFYLTACAVTGPGLIANLLFKDHWGRARPLQIEMFGGEAIFTPPLLLSDQCQRNCSFISGEASSIFLMFFALAMLFPAWRLTLVALGILGGLAAGLTRIAAGGHFFSDVIFAGIFMALTAQILHRIIFRTR